MDVTFSEHILNRKKFYDAFDCIVGILPDPDKIFKEKRYDYNIFRDLMKDAYFDGVWEKRLSAILKKKWKFLPVEDSVLSEDVATHFNNKFKKYNLLQLWGDILEANLFGFSCLEIIYKSGYLGSKKIWDIKEYWGKPQNWFGFDIDNNLVIKNKYGSIVDNIPDYKLLLTQYWPSYENPYGKKIASVLFWLLTFKKGGWKFFTIFLEKFGGAFASAEIPDNKYNDETFKSNVLSSLNDLVTGGIAVFPEKVKVTIHESVEKTGSKDLFKSYLDEINYNISIRTLGEHLTNTQNSNNRSATEISNDVRLEKTEIDISLIEPTINKSIEYWTALNYGLNTPLCKFEFERQQDLSLDIIDRDIKLIQNYRVRFKKEYIEETLGVDGDYFDLDNIDNNIETEIIDHKDNSDTSDNKKLSLFNKLYSYFSIKKNEKSIIKDNKLIDEFVEKTGAKFQKSVDSIIDELIDEIDDISDENKIFKKLIEKYPTLDFSKIVSIIDNARYCASQIGAYSGNLRSKKKTILNFPKR